MNEFEKLFGIILDTDKELTPKIPFYSIHRDEEGKVDVCVSGLSCLECLMRNNCWIREF